MLCLDSSRSVETQARTLIPLATSLRLQRMPAGADMSAQKVRQAHLLGKLRDESRVGVHRLEASQHALQAPGSRLSGRF